MDLFANFELLESAIHAGSAALDHIAGIAQAMEPTEDAPITCEICKCTW